VSLRMDEITKHMTSMEVQVALLETMEINTATMQEQIASIGDSTGAIEGSVANVGQHMNGTLLNVENIAVTMNAMNHEVQAMSAEMHRMAKPARTLNKIFPFP
jgi:hypothetical protein